MKYASAFPALLLTAIEHEAHIAGEHFMLQHTWVFVMLVNSLYSFYWDVEQDWDMPWLAAPVAQADRPVTPTGDHMLITQQIPDELSRSTNCSTQKGTMIAFSLNMNPQLRRISP